MKYLLTLFGLMFVVGLSGQVMVDFTDPSTATYTKLPPTDPNYQPAQYQDPVSGKMMMWAGDADGDGKVKYLGGLDADIFAIISVVYGDPGNTNAAADYLVTNTYHTADLNMDGTVQYLGGLTADIFTIIGAVYANPLNTGAAADVVVEEQLPSN